MEFTDIPLPRRTQENHPAPTGLPFFRRRRPPALDQILSHPFCLPNAQVMPRGLHQSPERRRFGQTFHSRADGLESLHLFSLQARSGLFRHTLQPVGGAQTLRSHCQPHRQDLAKSTRHGVTPRREKKHQRFGLLLSARVVVCPSHFALLVRIRSISARHVWLRDSRPNRVTLGILPGLSVRVDALRKKGRSAGPRTRTNETPL